MLAVCLAVACVLISGCGSPAIPAAKEAPPATASTASPPTKAASFETMAQALGKEFGAAAVRATKAGDGSICAVIVADQHLEGAEMSSKDILLRADSIIDIELVGVENYIESPDSVVDKAIVERVWNSITPDPSLVTPSVSTNPRAVQIENIKSVGHRDIFKRTQFAAIGVEDAEIYERIVPAATIEETWVNTVRGLSSGLYITVRDRNGLWSEQFLSWKLAEELMLQSDPNFPKFDFERMAKIEDLPKALYVGPEQLGLFEEYNSLLLLWMIQKACIPRNLPIATKLATEIKKRGFSRGGLVIGRGHLVSFGDNGLSVQEELHKLGVSTFVIDNPEIPGSFPK